MSVVALFVHGTMVMVVVMVVAPVLGPAPVTLALLGRQVARLCGGAQVCAQACMGSGNKRFVRTTKPPETHMDFHLSRVRDAKSGPKLFGGNSPVSASVYLVRDRCEVRWLRSRCRRPPPPCRPSSDTTLSRE